MTPEHESERTIPIIRKVSFHPANRDLIARNPNRLDRGNLLRWQPSEDRRASHPHQINRKLHPLGGARRLQYNLRA